MKKMAARTTAGSPLVDSRKSFTAPPMGSSIPEMPSVVQIVSEKEIPFTHIHNDLIYIRQQENTGENKLKEEYSTKTADKMTKEEIIKLCTKSVWSTWLGFISPIL